MDNFTQVSSQSWFTRIGNSIKGIVAGLVFILISAVLLWWNEGRAVETAKTLNEGSSAVVSVAADAVDPANNQKLVHVSGNVVSKEGVADEMFNVPDKALRISRVVEMYQWNETKSSSTQKNFGGGTETRDTFSYDKRWADKVIDSSDFKSSSDHRNPAKMIAPGAVTVAMDVTLGAFAVPAEIVEEMQGDVPLKLNKDDIDGLPDDLKTRAALVNGSFYFGKDEANPQIGDQRVSFKVLKPGIFSIMARQKDDTFEPYVSKAGGTIERVESGSLSADVMLNHAKSENSMLTWIFRLVGFVLMAIALGMIMSPIAVFADVIPFVGSILGAGVGLAALALAFVGSILIIAVAWLAARPLLGIVLIVLAVATLVGAWRHGGAKKAALKAATA